MPRKRASHEPDYFEYGVHVPLRLIWISGEIDDALATRVCKAFDELEAISHQPITVNLMSGGGSWMEALALYDRICRSPCKVTIIGTGLVGSSATAIFQAADERLITVNCRFMIHDGVEAFEGDPKSFEEWGKAARKDRILLYEIYANATGKSVEHWERMCAKDTILFPDEVIEHGLADSIIRPPREKHRPQPHNS